MSRTLFAIVASPLHPDLSALYKRLEIDALTFTSERKAIQQLKRQRPDIVVADFVYGYGNNYAGVNISNLDVFLYTLQKEAPDTRVLVLAEKGERQYVDKLAEIFRLDAVLTYPVPERTMAELLA
jgi:DNA-binding NarL/FixJ family response regulator